MDCTNKQMENQFYDIGMIGLGVMGRNLALNIADHGFSVLGYDKDTKKIDALRASSGTRDMRGAQSLKEFVSFLRTPRAIMMLVPAGPPVDQVIQELLPFMERGDVIIDGGNSHFSDMEPRTKTLKERGILFLGVGISGGEHGARHGPSIMPGGPREAYERVRPIFEAVAANVKGEPCVTYVGPGSSGHYTKMVHNGIEYGVMGLISETYDLMRRGLGATDDQLHEVYAQWLRGEANSYLLEITFNIFSQADTMTNKRLLDVILDEAAQTGTGMWTSQEAMKMQVPLPSIDVAVAMRNMSMLQTERDKANLILERPIRLFQGDQKVFIEQLGDALYIGMIIVYSQAMALLSVASVKRGYHLDLEALARIWRGGCIIRSDLLEDIRTAYLADPNLPNLLVDKKLSKRVMTLEGSLRKVVSSAGELGIPAPGLMVSLAYLDAYRSAWSPANLIQAQRDYFGSHTYERSDAAGIFHTQWQSD